ncbi:MAG: hypothetical protein II192_03460 [Clostridia bacterium]|nr:hypothetical protein [Clostridia bacterium]
MAKAQASFFAFSDECGKPFLCGNKAEAGRFSVCAASAAHTFFSLDGGKNGF